LNIVLNEAISISSFSRIDSAAVTVLFWMFSFPVKHHPPAGNNNRRLVLTIQQQMTPAADHA